MQKKAKGQPPKGVIAIPCEAVRKAGAITLLFPSVKEAAKYFGMTSSQTLSRVLRKGTKKLPTYGYYFDYTV